MIEKWRWAWTERKSTSQVFNECKTRCSAVQQLTSLHSHVTRMQRTDVDYDMTT